MGAAAGLTVQYGLWWVLGHVVADFGFVGAALLKDLIQLPQPLGHAGLFEVPAVLADIGVLLQ